MANNVAAINTLADEAVTAIGNADWATALTKLRQASARLATIGDSKFEDLSELEFDREAIARLIADIEVKHANAEAATNGLRISRVTYANPTG